MKRKLYLPPESRMLEIQTEQGICYSSDEQAKINEDSNIIVNDYKEVNNDVTFD